MTDLPPPGPPPWTPPPLPPITGRLGPPWERDGPWLTRFIETARDVLLDPVRAFSSMRREGGLQAPLAFAAIGVLVGALATALYDALLSGLVAGPAVPGFGALPMFGSGMGTMALLTVTSVLALLFLFIGAGIYHLLLMLFDGARQPFETTFRVVAYSSGSTAVLQAVPVCGAVIAAVWNVVATIIGLAQAQEIPLGKAAAAVLVPIAVCCFFMVALVLLFGLSLLALAGRG
jgi:hypothetical protein